MRGLWRGAVGECRCVLPFKGTRVARDRVMPFNGHWVVAVSGERCVPVGPCRKSPYAKL